MKGCSNPTAQGLTDLLGRHPLLVEFHDGGSGRVSHATWATEFLPLPTSTIHSRSDPLSDQV